jgi:Papain family cysteine protease
MDTTFNYTRDFGVESKSDYPYKGETDTCKYDKSKVIYKSSNYTDVQENSS